MYCSRCGEQIKKSDKFCNSCGMEIGSDNYYNEKSTPNEKSSLTLGIISLVLSFILAFFSLPLAIIGLVLGLSAKKATKRSNSGIILNIISLIFSIIHIAILVFIIIFFINYDTEYDSCECISTIPEKQTYDIEGSWNCSHDDNIIFQFEFYKPNKYTITKYNNLENESITGYYILYEDGLNLDNKYDSDFDKKDYYYTLKLFKEENPLVHDLPIANYTTVHFNKLNYNQIKLYTDDNELNYVCKRVYDFND